MIAVLRAVMTREIRLAARIGAGAELGLVFFLILISVTPFALGPDQKLLSRLAPALLWIAALLATLLGLDRLLQADEDDGVVDGLMLSETPLELILFAKALAHWLVTGLPLALIAPVLGLMLAIPPAAMLPLSLSLLVGTPALTLVGLDRDASPGRALAIGPRVAADGADTDLRRRGGAGSLRGAGVHNALPAFDRGQPHCAGRLTGRGGGGVAHDARVRN